MYLGSPEFMMITNDQLQKSKSERTNALKTNNWSGYSETLSELINELPNQRHESIPAILKNTVSLVKTKQFDSLDIHQLLLVENYLLSRAKTLSFQYYYHADMIMSYVDLVKDAPDVGEEISGYIFPVVGLSTLRTLTEFDIVDIKTNKIEQHYKLASGNHVGVEFRYKSDTPGEKLIKGSLEFMMNGEMRIMLFERSFTVR